MSKFHLKVRAKEDEMRSILLPIDGTMRSDAAVQSLIRQVRLGQIGTIHLINVQPRLGSYIARFLKAAMIRDFQRDRGAKALARAKRLLDEANVPYVPHIYAGDMVETIVHASKELAVDEIVMSANNLGVVGALELQSVVGRVLRRVSVPVSVVNFPGGDKGMPAPASADTLQLHPTP